VKAQARREACNFIHRTCSLVSNQHHLAFEIFAKGDYFELFSNGHAFARLDKAFCSEARRLVGLGVKFQACLERKRWEEVTEPSRSYADGTVTFSVDVNVKSLMNHADKVGSILLSSSIFLQCPTRNPVGETYYNPQILQIEGFHEKPDDIMIEADDAPTLVVIL
jgi:SWI/SNF-related matrix-associated actin-dependent regulator of chromatin subfamily A3